MTREEITAVAPTVRRLAALYRIATDATRTDAQRARAIDRFVSIAGIENINRFALDRISRLYSTSKGK